MAKTDYQKHFDKYKKFDGNLRVYCDTRKPKLAYDATKSAFKRIKKRVATGSAKSKRTTQKRPRNDPVKNPTTRQAKAELINLPKLPKGLKLPAKHQAVADEFLLCLVPAEAYMRIYPKCSYDAAIVAASLLLRKPNVALYLEYHRSIARAKIQLDLQWINKRRKQIAGTDLRDVADFGEGYLSVKESDDIKPEHSAAIKKVIAEKEFKYKPGPDGEFEEIIKVKNGIELEDRGKALKDLETSLNMANSDNSVNSTNLQVQQWWGEFLNPPEGGTRLSALGFAMRFDSINHKVPPTIDAQAKAELAVLRERSLLVQQNPIEIEEGISTSDLILQLVKESAQNGDRSQLVELAKTMAQMKITDKKFNFNMFSELAEMVGSEDEIGWEE